LIYILCAMNPNLTCIKFDNENIIGLEFVLAS